MDLPIHTEKYMAAYRSRKLRIYDHDMEEWCTPWQIHETRYGGLKVFYRRGPKKTKWLSVIHAGKESDLRILDES